MTPYTTLRKRALPATFFCTLLTFGLTFGLVVGAGAQEVDTGPELTEEAREYLEELKPSYQYANLLRDLFRMVDRLHYIDKELDRAFSLTTFERFVKNLDPQKNFFIRTDVEKLEQLKPGIYKAIHGRNLRSPYSMYQLRQRRAIQAMLYQLKLLEANEFDFEKVEYLEADREDAEVFADWGEWRDYWRRAIKNQLLLALMADSTEQEALPRLKRRLTNRIKTLLRNDSEDALASFVNSALSQYDPHTSYLPPQEYKDWLATLQTHLEGIGAALISRDDYIEVVRLIEGGPAQLSGQLQVGDKITGVISKEGDDLIDVVGMSLGEVVRLIRGRKGTRVELEIQQSQAPPGSATQTLSLVRDVIPIENQRASYRLLELDAYDRKWKIGVIRLPGFYSDNPRDAKAQSASSDIRKLIQQMKVEGANGLVLDMRNNGGGYLSEAINVAALFLPPGAFVQIRSQSNRIIPDGPRRSRPEWTEPMAVLVGRLSASASEIVAAAIQDYKRGLVLGATTFGKGTVQNTYNLGEEQGQLKLTRSKFYRINGGATQGKGVIPDLTLPTIWDPEQIGENAYDNAMEFDTIKAMKLHHQLGPQADLALLQALHRERRESQYGLQYLSLRRELLDKMADDNRIPLQWAEREQRQDQLEQQQLDLENQVRQAKDLEPFADWDSYLKWERKRNADPEYRPIWETILQTEAAQVLVDHIQHSWQTQTVIEH